MRRGSKRAPTPSLLPRPATAADVAQVAALHMQCIRHGFLVTLGPRFLRRLYRRVVRSAGSFLLVADGPAGVSGFVAVTEDTRRLYREFLVRDGLGAALVGAPSLIRAPARAWETLRYGTGTHGGDLPTAEILAVGVAPGARSEGVGGALVYAALDELRDRGIDAARVVTSARNESGLRMYQRAGFRPQRRTELHPGFPQEVLVWR
jgi:ribosomal protein S18 acetylase RimI-like enzyme